MRKHAMQFIIHKKKSSLFFICIIALSIALMLSVVPVFGAVINANEEMLGTHYGTHHTILFNVTQAQHTEIEKLNVVQESGLIYNFGSWDIPVNGNRLTLGYFDENAFSMGKQKLLQGRMPQAANEIVLEQNATYRFPKEVKLNDIIHLIYDENEHDFQVVGILSDYTNNWYTGSIQLRAGYNDLPNALVYFPAFQNEEHHEHMLVRHAGRDVYVDYSPWMKTNYADNDYYNFVAYEEQIRPLEMFRTVFFLIILIAIFLVFWVTIPLYLRQYTESYATLYGLGAEGEAVFSLYSHQMLFCFLLALPIGIGLSLFIISIAGNILGDYAISIFTLESLWQIIILFLLFAGVFLLIYRTSLVRRRGRSLSKNKKHTEQKQMKIKKNLTIALSLSYLQRNGKRLIAVILLIIILLGTFSFAESYFDTRMFVSDFERYPDYTIYNHGGRYNLYMNFYLMEKTIPMMSVKDVKHVQQLKGVRYTEEMFDGFDGGLGANIITPDATSYGMPEDFYKAVRKEMPAIPENIVSVCRYNIVILNEENSKVFQEFYPDAFIKGPLGDEIIVFKPSRETFDAQEKGQEGYSDKWIPEAYEDGGEMMFGRLTYSNLVIEEAVENPAEYIGFESFSHTIRKAYTEPINMEMKLEGIHLHQNIITIFMTDDAAEKSPLIAGYPMVSIYLEEDISPTQRAATDREIKKIVSQYPGMYFEVKQDRIEQERTFRAAIETALNIILILLGVFTVLTIYATLHLSILERKRSFGIFRALGMKEEQVMLSLWLEIIVYIGVAVLLSLIPTCIVQVVISFQMRTPIPFMEVGIQTLSWFLWGALLAGVIAIIMAKMVYKESITSTMRFGD